VVQVWLHSTGDASPLAALLLAQILPDLLGRRALPSGRLACLGATPDLHHELLTRSRTRPVDGASIGRYRWTVMALDEHGLVALHEMTRRQSKIDRFRRKKAMVATALRAYTAARS
jgi:hypothetical protein